MRDSLKHIQQKGIKAISPEQKRALQILLNNWPSAKELHNPEPFPSVFPSGYTRASYQSVTVDDLPSECYWVWRQCNAKVATQLDEITTVIIQKFNTRDRKTGDIKYENIKRPTYKLWNLRVLQDKIAFSFIFCEKGEPLQKSNRITLDKNYDLVPKITSIMPYPHQMSHVNNNQPLFSSEYLDLDSGFAQNPLLDDFLEQILAGV